MGQGGGLGLELGLAAWVLGYGADPPGPWPAARGPWTGPPSSAVHVRASSTCAWLRYLCAARACNVHVRTCFVWSVECAS
eukprot:scaffold10241_cov127-Isochrysis_galbana.AAC.2